MEQITFLGIILVIIFFPQYIIAWFLSDEINGKEKHIWLIFFFGIFGAILATLIEILHKNNDDNNVNNNNNT